MMPSPTSGRSRLRFQRGAAYTETLIMLPFFFIVFGCLLWVVKAYVGKSELDSRNRTCMWRHVMGGCGEPLPGCNIEENPILVGQVPDRAASSLDGLSSRLDSVSIDVDEMFGNWFSQFFDARDSSSFSRPRLMGGGQQELSTRVTNSCNETPTELGIFDFAAVAFCSRVGPCP